MSRSRLFFFALSILFVLPILTGTLVARDQEPDEDSLFKHLSVFTEVLSLVKGAYVEPADEDLLVAGALDGATDALDPFSVYVPAAGVEPYTKAREIGYRRSGLVLLRERGVVYVVGVVEGSPASEAGVRLGDVVSELGGESTRLKPLWELQSVLTGEPGTPITLKLLRGREVVEVSFELAPFTIPPIRRETVEDVTVLKLQYVADATVGEVEKLLGELAQGPAGPMILDLRGVAGGDEAAAYKIAGLFTSGQLGGLRERGGELVAYVGREPLWQGKLLLLVNRGTLGAGEIVATVLRQKLDVELVGERTFGYAGRVKKIELSAGGNLWLTDAFYTGPDGEPLNTSLEPDVRVSSFVRAAKEGEKKEDPILKRGLERLQEEDSEEESRELAA